MSEKRYAVRCVRRPKTVDRWITDGDQDGDRWEGSIEEAIVERNRLVNNETEDGWAFEIEQVAGPTGYNKYTDCQLADQKAELSGNPKPYHCHSDDCEECFGC